MSDLARKTEAEHGLETVLQVRKTHGGAARPRSGREGRCPAPGARGIPAVRRMHVEQSRGSAGVKTARMSVPRRSPSRTARARATCARRSSSAVRSVQRLAAASRPATPARCSQRSARPRTQTPREPRGLTTESWRSRATRRGSRATRDHSATHRVCEDGRPPRLRDPSKARRTEPVPLPPRRLRSWSRKIGSRGQDGSPASSRTTALFLSCPVMDETYRRLRREHETDSLREAEPPVARACAGRNRTSARGYRRFAWRSLLRRASLCNRVAGSGSTIRTSEWLLG